MKRFLFAASLVLCSCNSNEDNEQNARNWAAKMGYEAQAAVCNLITNCAVRVRGLDRPIHLTCGSVGEDCSLATAVSE